MTDRATLSKYLRKVTGDLRDAHHRIEELERRQSEPIAIVGMSCRYPGGVESPDDLWRLVAAGTDAIGPFPDDRGWDLERLYDPDPDNRGTSYVRAGGFLRQVAGFDAEFFGISPRDAVAMDPQQRLLMEATWEACEDAGIDPASLGGSETGVFAGAMSHDYDQGAGAELEGNRVSGGSGSVLSGRVAYSFGLEGPAVTVDTACSSSLVAIHLAAGALRGGECDLALAGGVMVLATPEQFIEFSRQRGLAPDGRCKPFAAAADGTAFSEGVGLLLLERLSDAQANGHEVLALVRGSAVNQDGASNGLTAPNGPSQERVIRQALANAGLGPAEVDAVEAHGTGTVLGDPIEARAVLATYGQGRERSLRLGSVKSNIGHAMAAAGVAGVIKMAQAMRHGVLPATVNFDGPTPHVDWSAGDVELLAEPVAWEPSGRPRRAGVSSFGVSGTNAHLVLEEPPPQPAAAAAPEPERPPLPATPWLLSAKSEGALRDQAGRLAAHLRANPDLDPAAVGLTLATARPHLGHRAAAVASSPEQLLEALGALAAGGPHGALVRGRAGTGKLAFLFPGQGPQWTGMGRELLDGSPVFAAGIRACGEALSPYVEFSLEEVLRREEESPEDRRVDVIQPALFAMTVALAGLWRAHGVEPAAVLGHSQGEVAAAHIAGALSLEDAARVVALRSRALTEIAGKGGMVSVQLSAERARERIEPWGGRLSLAALNSPTSSVVVGDPGSLEEFLEACEGEGSRARRLALDCPSHSSQVEALRERLLADLAPIEPRSSAAVFCSAMTGGPLDGSELGAEYWYRSMREPVRFGQAIESLLGSGFDAFAEVSAHPVLTMAVEETAAAVADDPAAVAAIGSLRREEGGLEVFAAALAAAHVHGVGVDWERLFAAGAGKRAKLPTYPFQRQRYWLEPASQGAGSAAAIGQSGAEHPLLGAVVALPAGRGWLLTGRLSLQSHPWLADHVVLGSAILPGAAFVELALRAAEQAGAEAIEELTIEAPLVLAAGGAVQFQVEVGEPDGRGRRPLAIHSRPEGAEAEWLRNVSGTLSSEVAPLPEGLVEWPPAGAEPVAVDSFYERAADLGIDYGPAFQGLRSAWRRGAELFAEVELGEEQAEEAERFGIHPALLDAAFHSQLLAGNGGGDESPRAPFTCGGFRLLAAGAARLRVRMTPLAADPDVFDMLVADAEGAPVAQAESLVSRPISVDRLGAGHPGGADSLFVLGWKELALPEGAAGELERRSLFAPIEAATGGSAPAPLVLECEPPQGLDPVAAATALCARALEVLQAAAADEGGSRLVFLARGAMAVGEGESADPALAALWGLVRSAQSEHPGRFALVDADASAASAAALAAALAIAGEPQLALREGVALAPRLARGAEPAAAPEPLDPAGTVLITGATGALGSLFARHLVAERGARHLLLASRRGAAAPGAAELAAELSELGAAVELVACDVAERAQLAELLAAIPSERPLVAVFHAAGVTDDGLIGSLDPERLATTMAPKASAAWHLHELTREIELAEFVLFSSVAAPLAYPGQGNYAAANAFLDALAHRRRAEGLAALALGWGGWDLGTDMVGALSDFDRARISRGGVVPFSGAEGLALYERARAAGRPYFVAASLDSAALRAAARAGELAPLLSGLVRVPARRARPAGSLAERLAAVPEAEREGVVEELVRSHVAAVLGHASAAAVDPGAPFKDLGFDSLAAVELRNRLAQASGLRLPATLVFDHPTPAAVAAFLRGEAQGTAAAPAAVRFRPRAEEPVAIVGIGCRYPGGVESPQGLWRLVSAGTDAISAFPDDRGWDLGRLFDPDPGNGGTSHAREGGFLHDAAEFDAEFFGIGPREARTADPQQRLLLEAAWEAFEDGEVDPTSLAGSATGVFAGVMHHDYGLGGSGSDELGGHQGAVSSGSVVSGRVAYSLGLEGPAVTVDTACSSSLVAMHLAAGALRGGECDLALAGGVTVMSTPGLFVEFSRQRGLAPDGRCKPFGAGADGTGLSEGVGLLLLERLSDAQANGHQVLALIRGSAVNQDGASNGLTAPNGPSQERVIRQALANAGLRPEEVDAVEAHGTGTALGDPIEAGALLATYGQEREQGEPLRLGSIKSNLGHTQAAAGVAGVIKMTMAMRHGELPASLHASEPTPHVDWSSGAVELLSESKPWQRGERPRRAGVSSFGISGTNAHLILEEAPPAPEPEPAQPALPATPLLLSARSEAALRAQGARLASHLRQNPELDLAAVGQALASSRASLSHRAAAIGADAGELLEALDALGKGEPHAGLIAGRAQPGKLAFLFSGQGAQRPGMGRELHEAFPVFAQSLEETCAALDPHLGRSLKELLFAPEGSEAAALLGRTEITQPALFAIEVALYRLATSFGLVPDYLIGHSIGELSAAHLAGVYELEDACRLIAARGALMGALPEGGAMVAIEASEEEVAAELSAGLAIAAVNSPSSLVVSGEQAAVLELAERFAAQGRKSTRLRVSHAFHSELMEPMLADFEAVAQEISYRAPQIPVVSNLSGQPLAPEQATDPAYWVAQVRQPVRFAAGIAFLQEAGVSAFLELGPDGALSAMARACLADPEAREPLATPLLRKGRPEPPALLSALAAAHANGVGVDWAALFGSARGRGTKLPTYPFQRQRFWIEASAAGPGDLAAAGQSDAEHPLLGATLVLPAEAGWLFTGRLSLHSHPWLADHVVLGSAIFPGTGFLELALKAAEEAGIDTVEELTIEAPLLLPEQSAVQLHVSVGEADEEGRRSLAIHSRLEDAESEWMRHACGSLAPGAAEQPEPLTEWPPPGAEPVAVEGFYERAAELGLDYGPAFQGLRAAWRRGEELFAEVELGEEQAEEAGRYGIHPALLDAALHSQLLVSGESGELRVPFAATGIRLLGAGASELRVRLAAVGSDTVRATIADPSGAPVASMDSLAIRTLDPDQLQASAATAADSLFDLVWTELPLPERSGPQPDPDPEPRRIDCVPREDLDPATAAQALCAEVLGALQEAIASEEAETPVAFLTRGAMAVGEGESPDPAAAAVWGLVRSAQAEHPGRFLLIDADASESSAAALPAALAIAGEPQLALREGVALAPRLARSPEPATAPEPLGPDGTVLITGASGTLGSLFARHLVAEHGARHLLLVSRRGSAAPGATELAAELSELGATVELVACDVAERAQLAELIDTIAPERPLVAILHCAGLTDDGLIGSLDRERLEKAMAPKASAAWHLHELTREIEGCELLLFSSIAASFENPGQGNYAAANAFLDALAQRRRGEGLAGASLAWGAWERESEITARLGTTDRARIARGGVRPLADAEGLELFERARALGSPHLLPVGLDSAALRAGARAGELAPLLRGLVRVPTRRARSTGSLATRLAAVPEAEREALVEELVRSHVAAVLGHAAPTAVDPGAPFKDLGFDSLAAVELRNRLAQASGLRLPATLVFDHPTPAAVAAFLGSLVDPSQGATEGVDEAIDGLQALFAGLDGERRERAAARLRSLLTDTERGGDDDEADAVERIQAASAEELLEIVENEIGAR